MPATDIKIAVAPSSSEFTADASMLARNLKLPLTVLDDQGFPFILVINKERLELRFTRNSKMGPISVDFMSNKSAYRHKMGGGRKQTIVRAVGLKGQYRPTVLDATAGLGMDAFVIACQGCRVTMCEQHPVLAALLIDGLNRAENNIQISEIIRNNMRFVKGDSVDIMQSLPENERPDTVYLDPMFPHRTKSALVKKEMQILQQLIGKDKNSDRLLAQALKTATKRVVVKRPASAPSLNNQKPDLVYETKKNRFDAYLVGR